MEVRPTSVVDGDFKRRGREMRLGILGRAWVVVAALVGAVVLGVGTAPSALADPVRDKCTAEAKGRVNAVRAKLTPEERENAKAAAVALGFLLGGIFMAAREASMSNADVDAQLFRVFERECLSGKGLEPLPASAPASPSTSGRTDGKPYTGASKSGGKCACKEMTECRGSWVTLSCTQLTDRCRNPRTPMMYTANACDKLKQLVGGF